MKKKIVAGLTGGIAGGKSKAAEMFAACGAYIIDTDIIARQVTQMPAVCSALRAAFPQAFAGDVLDRRRLRQAVFGDDDARRRLDDIMHPVIADETAKQISASTAMVTIVVVPLLFEAGFDRMTSPTITVTCDEDIRIDRLMRRDTITEALARRMLAAQMSDAQRTSRADIVIVNNGSEAELRAQVVRIYCELEERCGR